MEKVLSKKFVCKYCAKRYPCGKSLGGHLRSHKILNSTADDDDEKAKLCEIFGRKNSKIEFRPLSEVGEVSRSKTVHVLREKPKKTWRFTSLNSGSCSLQQQLNFCKECGKGFQSVKALCGHMACHSEKDRKRVVVDDDDYDSDIELSGLRRPRLSKRIKYTSLVHDDCCSSVSKSELEKEEVALSLMILSRDTRKWDDDSSVGPSNNNSTKSSLAEMGYIQKGGGLSRILSFGEYKGNKSLKGREFDNAEFEVLDDSDDEYYRGEMNNVKSDNSAELFLRDLALITASGGHVKGFISQSSWGNNGCESMSSSNESSQETDPFYTQTSVSKLVTKKKSPSSAGKKPKSRKSKGHQCPFCPKTFKSGQALGGHKRIHFIGASEETRALIEQEMRNRLDINIPAPIEE